MARRRAGRDVHGVFLLDKAAGITSNRALQQVRHAFGARKAGHTGSLDPFATGMLPICLGEASKTAGFMLDADKSYRATARLGIATDSGDLDGQVTGTGPVPELDGRAIDTALSRFRGHILQTPPMHSALKHGGEPLYRLARRGVEVERAPRDLTISRLELEDWTPPDLRFLVRCSKGTYVRTLAEDIASALGTCGHLVALRRLSVGDFAEDRMMSQEALESALEAGQGEACLLPVDAGLCSWPLVRLTTEESERFRHGNAVRACRAPGRVRVHDPQGLPLGVGEVSADGNLWPKRVFAYAPDEGVPGRGAPSNGL